MKSKENMENEVYCFVLLFKSSPEGLGMFFLSAIFARRLHRCAATPTTTERVTFKSSTAGLMDCTFEWFWTARILTSAHHSDMLRKRHSDLLRKWITEPHQMMIQKSVENRIFKQLTN